MLPPERLLGLGAAWVLGSGSAVLPVLNHFQSPGMNVKDQ